MRKYLILSTLLHLLLFLVVWLGLPRFQRPIPEPMQIIPVDIADLADVTAVKKAAPEKAEPKPEPKPEPPTPPEPPKPPPAPEPESKPEPQKAEEKAEPLPIPKPAPPKPEPPKQDALASILKNVSKMKQQEKTEPVEKPTPQKEPAPAPATPQVPATAERLTTSEEDALRRQLAQCWNVPVGARDVQNMSVDIYISVNADRTVRTAVVVDQARMATDPFFRSFAESALRSLYNPHCSPLALPPEKYQEWQDTIITFNPRDMF